MYLGRVKPVIEIWRRMYGDDSFFRNMEYLYDRLMERRPESRKTLEVVKEKLIRQNDSAAVTP